MTDLEFKCIKIIAIMLTVMVMSFIGGCDMKAWIEANSKPVLTDPIAQRLFAFGLSDNVGDYKMKADIVREIISGKVPIQAEAVVPVTVVATNQGTNVWVPAVGR